jgi:transposase
MAKPLVDDELWSAVEPLLPRHPPRPKGGMTLLNRLRQWQRAGVWDALHRLMLDRLRAAGLIDLSRVIVDSGSVRAMHGGKKRVRAPWTAGRTAPSTTWRPTPTGCRWRRGSPAPTATT